MQNIILNDPTNGLDYWLISYDSDGLVLTDSLDSNDALDFNSEQERDDAITLINANPDNLARVGRPGDRQPK